MMAIMQMHVRRNLLAVHLKKIIQPHCIAAFLGLKNNINAKEMYAIEGNISHFACFENIKCAGTSFRLSTCVSFQSLKMPKEIQNSP